MSRDETELNPVSPPSAKAPLRTYSRHGHVTKRSLTSLPGHRARSDDLIKLDVSAGTQRLAQSAIHGHKRARTTAALGKTLTDVFWEHLSSSAPAFSCPPEINHLEPGVLIENKKDADDASLGEQPYNVEAEDTSVAKRGEQGPRDSFGHCAHGNLLDTLALRDVKKGEKSPPEADEHEGVSQREFFDGTASLKHRIRRGSLLCHSPPQQKVKKVRRIFDFDESLRLVKASTASARPVPTNRTTQRKDSGPQKFRNLQISKRTIVKLSSDGFEHDEARPVVLGKRRRTDSIELGIGPLELTQRGVATQSLEGPTWIRGQKKSRVATTTSLWSRNKHFSASQFHIDSDEDIALVQTKPSDPADHVTGNRSKRGISHIVSDSEEEAIAFPGPHRSAEKHSTRLNSDIDVTSTLRAKQSNFPYSSDADEPVDLLVFPVGNEDEAALATITRTDTPDYGVEIDKEATVDLPPKRWVLNVLDCDEDPLALRPASSEWTRDVMIPNTSPRKQINGCWL